MAKKISTFKDYDNLDFTDDFLFCKIISNNLDIACNLLEAILDIEIKHVKVVETQKSLKFTPIDRGVRFDAYVEDDENTIYDVEMQTSLKPALGKRMRYYQGMIDLDTIEQGADFKDLRKSFIIFICTEQPFKDSSLPIYTFTTKCHEDPDINLNDETTKIIVNVKGDLSKASPKLKSVIE